MSDIDVVRRFNRYYTERIGVLSERYLGQRRSLAEARLLFEIGGHDQPLRDLRIGLGLDSGYLARLLRSLERQRLVRVVPDRSDRRARIVTLTSKGARELKDLNERSDAATDDLLAPLSESDRERSISAIDELYRLLRRAEVTLEEADPASKDAQRCLLAYADELDERFPEGFQRSELISPQEIRSGGVCFVAHDHWHAIGCGVLRRIDCEMSEIKHLWVDPEARGLGVSRLLLNQLEQIAFARGVQLLRLDTHEVLREAIDLYRTAGYVEIHRYGENPHAHLWFEKRLQGPAQS